jgi:hypothetical protein
VQEDQQYRAAKMERMMKLQGVLLKAMAEKITWWDAAEIIGVTDRTMRRWRERLEQDGHAGLADRREAQPSPKRVQQALQGAGLVARLRKRGPHRRRRQRRPLPGMLLHIDGSKNCGWRGSVRWGRPTDFCGSATWPSSMGSSRLRLRKRAARFAVARGRI